MKTQKIKAKHLSVPALILLLILSFVRLTRPEFDKKGSSVTSGKFNTNQNTSSVKDRGWQPQAIPFNAENINTNSQEEASRYTQCAGQPVCYAKVLYAIDGDTIYLSTREKVRYVGMDTPETKHPIKKVQCFGKEASDKNKELVQDKIVRLERDVSDKDRYGRLLRFVYLPADQNNGSELFVNDYLTRQGYARAATFPPDVKLSQEFLQAEREARDNSRGLWTPGVCP